MATGDVQDVLIWGPNNEWVSLEGPAGSPGTAATVNVGTTTTSAPGGNADVQNVGSENAAVLNFTIPRGETGDPGDAGTQQVGTVITNTGNPGGDASVVINNAGDATAAVWDYTFNIPKGEKGDTGTGVSIIGSIDEVGPPNAGDYPDIENGDIVVDSNGDGWLWDGADFSNVGPIRGPEGPAGDAASVSATATANQVACDQPASVVVVNNGTSSAAQFAFSFNLPEGCKGDPGEKGADGENAEVYAQANQPTAKAVGAIWIQTAP